MSCTELNRFVWVWTEALRHTCPFPVWTRHTGAFWEDETVWFLQWRLMGYNCQVLKAVTCQSSLRQRRASILCQLTESEPTLICLAVAQSKEVSPPPEYNREDTLHHHRNLHLHLPLEQGKYPMTAAGHNCIQELMANAWWCGRIPPSGLKMRSWLQQPKRLTLFHLSVYEKHKPV